MKKMHGVVAAMVTPVDCAGKIDEGRLNDYIEFLIINGINALYPLGTTGEMVYMTLEERKKIAEAVIKCSRGRISVFIHTGSARIEDVILLSRHAYDTGADGIGVVTPFFMAADDRVMEEYYASVAASIPSDFPVYMYNIPQCSANDLKPETARRIALRCPNIVGIKYSFPDMVRTLEYLSINNGNFSVLCGPDSILQAVLALGCDGIVSGIAGVFPELISASYRCFLARDFERSKKLQFFIHKVCVILKYGSNMAYFKKALFFREIDVGFMRRPQLDITEEEAKALKLEMDGLLCAIKELNLDAL